jgi:hypothetical protein
MVAATYEFVMAMKQQRTWRLVSCALLIAVSIALRFNGIAMAGAMGLVLLVHGGPWGRRGRFLLALIPVVAMAGLIAWDQTHKVCPADLLKVQNSPPGRAAALGYALPLLPRMLPATLAYLAGDVGLALLPVMLAVVRRRHLARAAVIFAVIAGGCLAVRMAGIDFPLPLQDRQTWALTELGAMQPLVPGHTPFVAPGAVYWGLAMIGWASTAVLLATQIRRHSAVEWFLIWSAVFTIVLMGMLWLIHDRYVLPIAVVMAILVLANAERIRIWRAVPVLVVFGAICIVGTRDQQRYNQALWTAVARLHDAGAKDSEIIGGYTVNGWLQYAHPANAPVEKGYVIVPWVTGQAFLRYEICNDPPLAGRVIGVQGYRRWLRPRGQLFLVDHQPSELRDTQVAKSGPD